MIGLFMPKRHEHQLWDATAPTREQNVNACASFVHAMRCKSRGVHVLTWWHRAAVRPLHPGWDSHVPTRWHLCSPSCQSQHNTQYFSDSHVPTWWHRQNRTVFQAIRPCFWLICIKYSRKILSFQEMYRYFSDFFGANPCFSTR